MHPGGGLHHDHGDPTDAHRRSGSGDALVADHPLVERNRYTAWFSGGAATRGEVRHLTVQFSVFSHLFVEAQLRKVINAADLDTYRAGKEILLNELGVVFNVGVVPTPSGTDPDLVAAMEGTVDGGIFRFRAAKFEWLLAGRRGPWAWASTTWGNAITADPTHSPVLRRPSAALPAARWPARRGRLRGRTGPPPILAGAGRRPAPHQGDADARAPDSSPSAPGTADTRVEAQHAGHVSDEVEDVVRDPWFDTRTPSRGAPAGCWMASPVFWDGFEADHPAGVEDDGRPCRAEPRWHRPPRMVVGDPRAFGGSLATPSASTSSRTPVRRPGPRRVSYPVERAASRSCARAPSTPNSPSPRLTSAPRRRRPRRAACRRRATAFDAAGTGRLRRRRPPRTSTATASCTTPHHGPIATPCTRSSTVPRTRAVRTGVRGDRSHPCVGPGVGLTRVDHVVANVEQGHLDEWVDYYQHGLGLSSSRTSTTSTSPPSTRR